MAIPMLVDTQRAGEHGGGRKLAHGGQPARVMAAWAVMIAALSAVGMLTAMLGLIVIIPWLAHASWHAYLELTANSPYKASA
jgi:uncharacterized membrane protein